MKLFFFFLSNIILLFLSIYIVWYVRNKNEEDYVSISEILNRNNLSIRSVAIGSVFGFVFGFIDNLFLAIGIDNLQKYFPGDIITKSGLGNTYSDVIASFVGTSAAYFVTKYTNSSEDEVPLWANSFGMFWGCLVGLYVGKLVAYYT